jgi:hypothetical protein
MSGSSFKENIMTYEEKLHKDIKYALMMTIPALVVEKDELLEWRNGETEEIAHCQAQLLIDKCDFVTVYESNIGTKTIFIRFENIVLRGTKNNRFWDIYLSLDKASSRYPRMNFFTLKPEYADMEDSDNNKFRNSHFTSAIHPHISNHAACFGEFEKPLMALLSSFNYAGAVMMIRKFIDTWNRDSAYWDMNVMNSPRWNMIHSQDREFFNKLPFAEKVYLKREIYDNVGDGQMRSFGRLVSFVVKVKNNYKAGIDWKSLNHFYNLRNHIGQFTENYLKDHIVIGFIDNLFREPRRDDFTWYHVNTDIMIRKRLVWFNCRIIDFKRKFSEVLLDGITPKMLVDYCNYYMSPRRDERAIFHQRIMIKLQAYAEVRCKAAMSDFNKSQLKMSKLPLELRDIWCTKENVDNIFNIDFLTQLMDEARLQCCIIALKRIRTKERKLRNEIATLRGDALQAELFSEKVPEQGMERPSVVQPES